MKHWCVTEKGHTNTRRIHLHGIFYALIRNEATRVGINLTKEQIKKITNDINVSWEKLRQGDESNAIQAIFQVLSKDSNTANMKMDWAQESFKKIFNDYMKAREK